MKNYQLKKLESFEDDIDLLDESGNVVKTIHLSLDLETIALRYTAALRRLEMAEKAAIPYDTTTTSMYGACVIEFLQVIFGDDTEAVLAHFKGHYMDMLNQVLPYIYQRIGQRIQAIRESENMTGGVRHG